MEHSAMIVTTRSGTRYEFSGFEVRRLGGDALRRDEEWLKFEWGNGWPEVGKPMILLLEPLGEGNVTIRTTTEVVSIDD